MKRFRFLFVVLIILTLAFSLTACKDKEESTPTAENIADKNPVEIMALAKSKNYREAVYFCPSADATILMSYKYVENNSEHFDTYAMKYSLAEAFDNNDLANKTIDGLTLKDEDKYYGYSFIEGDYIYHINVGDVIGLAMDELSYKEKLSDVKDFFGKAEDWTKNEDGFWMYQGDDAFITANVMGIKVHDTSMELYINNILEYGSAIVYKDVEESVKNIFTSGYATIVFDNIGISSCKDCSALKTSVTLSEIQELN